MSILWLLFSKDIVDKIIPYTKQVMYIRGRLFAVSYKMVSREQMSDMFGFFFFFFFFFRLGPLGPFKSLLPEADL